MNFVKYLIPLLAVAVCTATGIYAQVVGQETAFDRQLNTRDDQALREFVQSKENIDIKEKSNNLEISGDVRFEWRSIREKGISLYTNPYSDSRVSENADASSSHHFHQNYRALRGGDHVDSRGIPLSTNDFDVEFNLKVKYSYKRAWAAAHLQFDNPAGIRARNDCFGNFAVFNREGSDVEEIVPRDSRFGIKGSGEGMFITLKRAYIGYNILADGKYRLDVELGRRKLDDIFDSEIEFTSRFDGILLKFATSIEEITDLYWNTGVFVIDERVNHFGYVTEIGLLDIYDTGLDLKYSFIDWEKRGHNRCFIYNPIGTRFQNSQVSLSYTFSPTIGCYENFPIELYGGYLVNHAAKKSVFTNRKRKNLGWYAGIYIGNVDKAGDWSIDIEYAGVQAQAVPEYDVGSIGRGNILDENLLDIVDESFPYASSYASSFPSSHIVGYFPRRGNTNFTGWRFEFLYAITDNFSIDTIYEFSKEEDKRIGGPHHYCDFEIEAVYAF